MNVLPHPVRMEGHALTKKMHLDVNVHRPGKEMYANLVSAQSVFIVISRPFAFKTLSNTFADQ